MKQEMQHIEELLQATGWDEVDKNRLMARKNALVEQLTNPSDVPTQPMAYPLTANNADEFTPYLLNGFRASKEFASIPVPNLQFSIEPRSIFADHISYTAIHVTAPEALEAIQVFLKSKFEKLIIQKNTNCLYFPYTDRNKEQLRHHTDGLCSYEDFKKHLFSLIQSAGSRGMLSGQISCMLKYSTDNGNTFVTVKASENILTFLTSIFEGGFLRTPEEDRISINQENLTRLAHKQNEIGPELTIQRKLYLLLKWRLPENILNGGINIQTLPRNHFVITAAPLEPLKQCFQDPTKPFRILPHQITPGGIEIAHPMLGQLLEQIGESERLSFNSGMAASIHPYTVTSGHLEPQFNPLRFRTVITTQTIHPSQAQMNNSQIQENFYIYLDKKFPSQEHQRQ